MYILGVYRIPAGQLEEALNILSTAIAETKAEHHAMIIIGDINVDGFTIDRNAQILNNI